MALKTNISLTPATDWKSILLDDTTGFGITGYGNNQEPVGFRSLNSSGDDIQLTKILCTAPDTTVYTVDLSAAAAYSAASDSYTLTNTFLGEAVDDPIADGIWKVEYVPFMSNNDPSFVIGSPPVTLDYSGTADSYFRNATWLYDYSSAPTPPFTGQFDRIVSINEVTDIITVQDDWLGSSYENYPGIGVIKYTPIAKAIKECLDEKIVKIATCQCVCSEGELQKLMNMYLLYDAMFVACQQNNPTKAQQIFDLLTTYCSEICGC